MKRRPNLLLLMGIVLLVVACAPKNLWKSEPSIQKASNQFYDASISPVFRFDGYKGFLLNVHNKTDRNINIDWGNTFYIQSGNKDGGFWFGGIPQGAQNKPVSTDIVSGDMLIKEIYPAKLRVLSQLAAAYVHDNMGTGENGIYLTVNVQGKPVSETLTLVFSQE